MSQEHPSSRQLSHLYQQAHDDMRDIDGLLPQEAFDELLKFLFYKECSDRHRSVQPASLRTTKEIRTIVSTELPVRAPWALQIWPSGRFALSDHALASLERTFAQVRLAQLSFDVRSTALWTFLKPDLRRSLGIFTTPDSLVRAMVDVVAPSPLDIVLDPACGTGTFLLEAARSMQADRLLPKLYGVEKNPRVLLLAELNLACSPLLTFERACADSLRTLGRPTGGPLGLKPDSVDVVLTNPPFGVSVNSAADEADLFGAKRPKKTPSEVLFVELCLRLLKPGGRLGIILPRSVITNESLARHRRTIDQMGFLTDVVELPSETFVSTGAQTTTVAAFFQKRRAPDRRVSVRVCQVTNVGFDTTGRDRKGSQLDNLGSRLRSPEDPSATPLVVVHGDLPATETLQRAASYVGRRNEARKGIPMDEFIEMAHTGRTPGRGSYTNKGTFIVKVGNLTGCGIDWTPRDRNFVSDVEGSRRADSVKLSLRPGDILLTSSAHAAQYIAKKVDIVDNVPTQYKMITYVGELIRLRAKPEVDPFVLLAALRQAGVRADLQANVRGQTAHLYPGDLLQIGVPWDLRSPEDVLEKVAALLRKEAALAFQRFEVSRSAAQILDSA